MLAILRTVSLLLTADPCFNRNSTTSSCPFSAATMRAVHPSCKTRAAEIQGSQQSKRKGIGMCSSPGCWCHFCYMRLRKRLELGGRNQNQFYNSLKILCLLLLGSDGAFTKNKWSTRNLIHCSEIPAELLCKLSRFLLEPATSTNVMCTLKHQHSVEYVSKWVPPIPPPSYLHQHLSAPKAQQLHSGLALKPPSMPSIRTASLVTKQLSILTHIQDRKRLRKDANISCKYINIFGTRLDLPRTKYVRKDISSDKIHTHDPWFTSALASSRYWTTSFRPFSAAPISAVHPPCITITAISSFQNPRNMREKRRSREST